MHINHLKQCLAHRKHRFSVSCEDNVHFLWKGLYTKDSVRTDYFCSRDNSSLVCLRFSCFILLKDHWRRVLLDFLSTRSILRFNMEVHAWNCRRKPYQRENNMSDTVWNFYNALIPSIHITVLWYRHFLSPQFCIELLHHCCYIR